MPLLNISKNTKKQTIKICYTFWPIDNDYVLHLLESVGSGATCLTLSITTAGILEYFAENAWVEVGLSWLSQATLNSVTTEGENKLKDLPIFF